MVFGNVLVWLVLVCGFCLDLSSASGFCSSTVPESHGQHHHCDHGHDHRHHHKHHAHDHHQHHHHKESLVESKLKLPEELAEEEDMRLYGFGFQHDLDHDHDHDHEHLGVSELSGVGLWMNALGCSFLAGAMLGDAFLHQLPHAFGGGHSHSHDHHDDHVHDEHHLHAHSLADLSVGISVLAGIVLFLLVEKVVRYVEDYSGGTNAWSHTHHHHHHKKSKKLKDDNDMQSQSSDGKDSTAPNNTSEEKVPDDASHNSLKEDTQQESYIRKRRSTADRDDKEDVDTAKLSASDIKVLNEKEHSKPSSNLVIGYLNLFSDGVHNFTDGIALGSAFLLYGSVGGWSRTLFLLAHELPQEVGDFGILVRSGFSVSKALFFNFLSALVALAGTAMALLLGKDPGQSSLIEGFTAGGFIYIAVAGVLAEMNNNGSSTVKSTGIHLISLILGMGVALCISLVE
nr:IAA-alanine resistance protein 1 isoform X2 [Ziziphus jujuba var. spinosa]